MPDHLNMKAELEPIVGQFREAANRFIGVVDSAPYLSLETFLSKTSHCLGDLYCSALNLPGVEPETTNIDDTPFHIEEWATLLHSLKEKIGSRDAYWRVFDSTEKSAPVEASLAGDLSEIYFDLKHDLSLVDRNISRHDWLWELRFSFRSHWGRHLIGALTAIRDLSIE